MTNGPLHALRYFLGRHATLSAILLAVLLLSAVLEGLTAASLFPFVSAMVGQGMEGKGGPFLRVLQGAVNGLPVQDKVIAATLFLITVVVLKGVAVLTREALIAHGGARIVHEAKRTLLSRLANAPYTFYLRSQGQGAGRLHYQLTVAPQNLGAVLLLLPYVVMQLFTIIVIVALLLSIDWQLTLFIGLAGLGIYTVIGAVSQRVSYATGKGQMEALSREHGIVREFLQGFREIVVARAAPFWTGRFETQSDQFRRLYVRDLTWQAMPGVMIETIFFVVVCALVVIYRWQTGGSSEGLLPTMAVYAYAVYRLVGSISVFSRQALKMNSKLPDVELLCEAIRTVPRHSLDDGGGDAAMRRLIAFDRVAFTYPDRAEPALRDLTFEIPKGAVTAIIGASGSGKSTIVNLVTRLLDPASGRIFVDGQDLMAFNREAWLRRIGYVGRESFLFNGTIEENIRFGLTSPGREAVEHAACVAQAHEFIVKLPQGYETEVGERGLILSDGQRQRLAIARAILRNPEILIFDEGMSALDNLSEALIQKAIADLARDHTVIIVAHRLSTVRFADQIVVLDRGRVVEVGKHDELLARKGQYSLMMASSGE
jgi:ABC-type multidrug transport system fused ATPase/permease subunit